MNNTDYLHSKEILLDFSKCKYLSDVHNLIKAELELPEFYGCNLDALWAAITGIMYVPANIKIIFKPQTSASENLKEEIEKVIQIFKEAEDEYNQLKITVEK